MNEYAIHAKIKNNLILRRILDAGHKNVAQFCKTTKGLEKHQSAVGELINMRAPAVSETGEWRDIALRVADALGVLPDELFTEEQMTARLKRNDAYIELSRGDAIALMDDGSALQKRLEDMDVVSKLLERANLNSRERLVLECRMGGDDTLHETAQRLHVSRERVAQIEAKALRKMRTASRLLRNDQAEACIVPADPCPDW